MSAQQPNSLKASAFASASPVSNTTFSFFNILTEEHSPFHQNPLIISPLLHDSLQFDQQNVEDASSCDVIAIEERVGKTKEDCVYEEPIWTGDQAVHFNTARVVVGSALHCWSLRPI